MKVATFNIWNNETMFIERLNNICNELIAIDADIVCFQEVMNDKFQNVVQEIANRTVYKYHVFFEYPDSPDEGLGIISKNPILSSNAIWERNVKIEHYCAIHAVVIINNLTVGVTNLHLNWRGVDIRLLQLQEVLKWIDLIKMDSDCELLLGDFNDIPGSKVYERLLDNGWRDTVDYYKDKTESEFGTFDLIKNPYLAKDERPKGKLRYDWIMYKSFKNELHMNVNNIGLFANDLNKYKDLPSDHYGFFSEFNFQKGNI